MNRFILWLNYFLQDLEYRQGWRPIPLCAGIAQQLEESAAWLRAMNPMSLAIQCAMHGHRYDQWFDGGEICLTCGEKRMRPTVAEKKPTERSQRVDSIVVALQLRPDTVAEARELRRRTEEIAHER